MRIFGADIDVAYGCADGQRRDGHAFDQEERIALHQHAVGERAAVAFIGVADDVILISLDPRGRAPFNAGWKTRPTTPAQARGKNLLDRRLRTQRSRAFEARGAAVTSIVVKRQRVRHSAASEYEALLFREIGEVLDGAQPLW